MRRLGIQFGRGIKDYAYKKQEIGEAKWKSTDCTIVCVRMKGNRTQSSPRVWVKHTVQLAHFTYPPPGDRLGIFPSSLCLADKKEWKEFI